MPTAFIGIGSNRDPARHVRAAVAGLREAFGPVRCSTVYETPAVGFEGPPFLNLVAAVEAPDDPEAVVGRLKAIEDRFEVGERRPGPGSRFLDLDLLLLGDRVQRQPAPLPHPDCLAYPFVLRGLAELAPDWRHPERGRTFGELWGERSAEAARGCRSRPGILAGSG